MSKKKKKPRPPVETGHDDRAEEIRQQPLPRSDAAAPDGVSGDWT